MIRLRTVKLVLLLALFPLMGVSQSTSYYQLMLDDQIKLSQRPGTEVLLHKTFVEAVSAPDTLTVFFMTPGSCPRCESTVAQGIQNLKALKPDEKVLIYAAYEDAEAADRYIEQQHFGEDYRLFDTGDLFNQVFSSTFGGLQGIFVARIDVVNGRMITGGEYNYALPEFFREFLAVRSPLPMGQYDEGLASFRQERQTARSEQATRVAQVRVARSYDRRVLDTRGELPSNIRNHPMVRGKDLILTDQMCSNAGLRFTEQVGGNYCLKEVLQIDSTRRDDYIKLPAELYQVYKHLFRYMPLDVIFMPDSSLAMSYSIPDVRLMEIEGQKSVGFWNKITFLRRKLSDNHWQPLATIDSLDLYKWMVEHYRIFPIRPGHIVMTCHKMAWPMWINDDQGNPETDPFIDTFYDQRNPYAVEVDLSTNQITKWFGQLEDVFRQTRTGYWLAEVVADEHKGQFVYGNQVVGQLYLTQADAPDQTLRTYTVFTLPDPPQPDSKLFYNEEYLQFYKPYFNHTLEQVTLDDDYINCLVRTGVNGRTDFATDTYEYIRISRQSGRIVTRYELPAEHDDELLLAYGLTANDGDNCPFYISKRGGSYYITYVRQ